MLRLINWTAEFPELRKLGKKNEKLDLLHDLLPLELGPLYPRFCTPLAAAAAAGGNLMYGFIPFMALACLGSDLVVSYVECVVSAAKDCMPEGSTLLADLPLEMFTILWMNAEFIDYFETKHPIVVARSIQDIDMDMDMQALLVPEDK